MKIKSSIFNNTSKILLAATITASMSACVEKDFSNTTTGGNNSAVSADSVNAFSTRANVNVNLKFESKAYFEIYAQNPIKTDENGQEYFDETMNGKSLLSRTTDTEGNFNEETVFPAGITTVYIYSPTFGAERLQEANIVGSELQIKNAVQNKARTIVAIGKYINDNLYPNKLGETNLNGSPKDYIDEEHKITVDQTMKQYINYNLPEGGTDARYKSFVNDEDNDLRITKDAEVWFNYVGGETSAQSTLGYYCYEDGATIDEIKDAAKNACLIFANTHKSVLTAGIGVQLKYINNKGQLKGTTFPAGTKIGFILYNNGWIGGNGSLKNSINYSTSDLFYSTKALNRDGRAHTANLSVKDGNDKSHNIIAFEDWSSYIDYNDVTFAIQSNPIDAINTKPADDPKEVFTYQNFKGLLSFEDNWPKAGNTGDANDNADFDINDVVVKYFSTQTINGLNNLVEIKDSFQLCWTGASESNAFAYEINAPYNSITVEGEGISVQPDGNKTIITVFDDAREELGCTWTKNVFEYDKNLEPKSYVVKIKFNNPSANASSLIAPYNPFIKSFKGYEVHLTNYAPTNTAMGNNTRTAFRTWADASNGVNTFFVYKGNNYPFALHMDARADDNMFILADDFRKNEHDIVKNFPGFAEWAVTKDPTINWWKK